MNVCVVVNGGCQQLCLYWGCGQWVCVCVYGMLVEDGVLCCEYVGYLFYLECIIFKSIYLLDECNFNVFVQFFEDFEYMKNVIVLVFDYWVGIFLGIFNCIFFSDIYFGNIQQINDDGFRRIIIVENVGFVEGLVYYCGWDIFYWISYMIFIIMCYIVDQICLGVFECEIVIIMFGDDYLWVFVLDECQNFMFWINWNEQYFSIMWVVFLGVNVLIFIEKDICIFNGLVIDYCVEKFYFFDVILDKIEWCEYDGFYCYVILKLEFVYFFGLVVYGEYIFWIDWVWWVVQWVNKYVGSNMKLLCVDIFQQFMGIIVVVNDINSCEFFLC